MFRLLVVQSVICCALGTFTGPFVLWGREELKTIEMSALERLDDKVLRNIYSEATAIVMFLRNASSSSLSEENYPSFKKVISKTNWAYLPQHWLTSDPVDYNVNAEVINLVGPASQQDTELAAIFHDTERTFGRGKVLGILASKSDEHEMRKREAAVAAAAAGAVATEEPSTTSMSPTEEPMVEDFIYIDSGKTMMYTTSPPCLTDNETTTELRSHGLVTTDARKDEYTRLIISFKVNRTNELTKLTLRFRFPISNGYWSLTSVEVQELNRNMELTVVDEPPTAPIGFSYKCSSAIVFRDGGTTLTLENIQVQPLLDDRKQFSDAYDCVGFTTAPIWSGIFVSSILLTVLALGLACILEIKTPNKFENTRGKQLTFTVQE